MRLKITDGGFPPIPAGVTGLEINTSYLKTIPRLPEGIEKLWIVGALSSQGNDSIISQITNIPSTVREFYVEYCPNLETLPPFQGVKKLKISYTGIRHLNVPNSVEELEVNSVRSLSPLHEGIKKIQIEHAGISTFNVPRSTEVLGISYCSQLRPSLQLHDRIREVTIAGTPIRAINLSSTAQELKKFRVLHGAALESLPRFPEGCEVIHVVSEHARELRVDIPNTVKEFYFSGCFTISRPFHEGLKKINIGGFPTIREVNIPSTVEKFCVNDCPNLESVAPPPYGIKIFKITRCNKFIPTKELMSRLLQLENLPGRQIEYPEDAFAKATGSDLADPFVSFFPQNISNSMPPLSPSTTIQPANQDDDRPMPLCSSSSSQTRST